MNWAWTTSKRATPGSNPKDARLYQILKENPPKHAKLAAFGSTCRVGVVPEDDYNVCSLLSAQTPVVTIFGKSWDFHVCEVLRTDLAENLRIVEQTVRYLKEQGKEVVFDAEHFFDGCKHNLEYALEVLRTAEKAGADWIALCDTNGGCMVHEIEQYTRLASGTVKVPLGIHCHNDTGQAVSCSIAALRSGASMAQLTLNGWGSGAATPISSRWCPICSSKWLRLHQAGGAEEPGGDLPRHL